tara:strand:- start:1236 stop:1598 length:363 start_codon:yes stop_codon:yes gene_type:complete
MENQIPAALSPEQLQSFLENAAPEPEAEKLSLDELEYQAKEEVANAALQETNNPDVHKIMLHMIVANMCEWHSKVSLQLIESGEPDHSIQWARDAGKWQAIMNILDTISVSDDDQTCVIK